MAPTQTEQPSADQINDRYWNGDQTVDRLVEEMEISRSALYASLRPVPAGVSCDRCGERMVFSNRTNRSNELATCRSCGNEGSLQSLESTPTAFGDARNGLADDMVGIARWRDDLSRVEPERYALVGGAAALGVVLGAAATRAIREML